MGSKDDLFNKRCRGNWISIQEKVNFDHYFLPYTNANSRRVVSIDIHFQSETKFLEKNIGEYLHGLGVGKYLDTKITNHKKNGDKLDYVKFFKKIFIYLFWLCPVLVAACGIFSFGMQTS